MSVGLKPRLIANPTTRFMILYHELHVYIISTCLSSSTFVGTKIAMLSSREMFTESAITWAPYVCWLEPKTRCKSQDKSAHLWQEIVVLFMFISLSNSIFAEKDKWSLLEDKDVIKAMCIYQHSWETMIEALNISWIMSD